MANNTPNPLIVDLNENNFAAEVEQASLPVFLDFWAPWCGPCVALAPLFEQLAEAYRDQIKFAKVNADGNKELLRRFNIKGVPTLLLLRDGQVVAMASGRSKSALANLLDPYVQRPLAVKAATQRSFLAFHGDASLRESVVARLRDHIHGGRIVNSNDKAPITDTGQQHYSLMVGALGNADPAAFESTLGIPGSVGRLQESVHELLLQQSEGNDDEAVRLQPPHDAWPLDWWRAIPSGVDLQSLPSRFIAWLLQERAAEIYPYALSEEAQAIMTSLANLHLRAARGDAPTDEEWRAVRNAAGDWAKREKPADRHAADEHVKALEGVAMLAWPIHELDNALPDVVLLYLRLVAAVAIRRAYTPEQWQERNAADTEFFDKLASMEQTYADRNASEDAEMVELRERMIDGFKRRQPFETAASKPAHRAFAERLHAGLMQALNDTVSGV